MRSILTRSTIVAYYLLFCSLNEMNAQDGVISSIFKLGAKFQLEGMEEPLWLLKRIEEQSSNRADLKMSGETNSLRKFCIHLKSTQYEVSLPNENCIVLEKDSETQKIMIPWNWKNQKEVNLFHASANVLCLSNGDKIAFVRGDSLGKSIVCRLNGLGEILWKTIVLDNNYDGSGPPAEYFTDIVDGKNDVVILGNRLNVSFAAFLDKKSGVVDMIFRIPK